MILRETIIKKAIFILPLLLFLQLCHAASSEALEIVYLKSADIKPYNDALEGFKTSCGCSVTELDIPGMEDQAIARKVLRMKPDAVLAIGMDSLNHALIIKDLPVIYAMAPNHQLISAGPANLSGVSMHISAEKYLSTMLELFPSARRIGVIYDPKNTDVFVKEAVQAAQPKGIELVLRKAHKSGDVPALTDGLKDRIDVLWMIPDTTVVTPETVDYMLLFSFQNRVPIFSFSGKYIEMGAVGALVVAPFDLGVQAGEIARELESQKNVGTPVRANARKAVLLVNKKVARKMGLKIKPEIMDN